jgi:hypothetical protein
MEYFDENCFRGMYNRRWRANLIMVQYGKLQPLLRTTPCRNPLKYFIVEKTCTYIMEESHFNEADTKCKLVLSQLWFEIKYEEAILQWKFWSWQSASLNITYARQQNAGTYGHTCKHLQVYNTRSQGSSGSEIRTWPLDRQH